MKKNRNKSAKNNPHSAVSTQFPKAQEASAQASAAAQEAGGTAAGAAASAGQAVSPAIREEMLIQFGEHEVAVHDIFSRVRQECLAACAQADVKEIKVYVKPEDNKAYYVLNGEIEGSVDLV